MIPYIELTLIRLLISLRLLQLLMTLATLCLVYKILYLDYLLLMLRK